MAELNIQWDKNNNVRIVEGKSLVFHCHHYNCFLQKSIEGPKTINGKEILTDEALKTSYEHFTKAFSDHKELKAPKERLMFASMFFQVAGFGIVRFNSAFTGVSEKGGKVFCSVSHYAKGWVSKFGKRDTPCCHFNTGWISGALAAAFDKERYYYITKETKCEAVSGKGCTYLVEVR